MLASTAMNQLEEQILFLVSILLLGFMVIAVLISGMKILFITFMGFFFFSTLNIYLSHGFIVGFLPTMF